MCPLSTYILGSQLPRLTDKVTVNHNNVIGLSLSFTIYFPNLSSSFIPSTPHNPVMPTSYFYNISYHTAPLWTITLGVGAVGFTYALPVSWIGGVGAFGAMQL